jgi:hypothetical protein
MAYFYVDAATGAAWPTNNGTNWTQAINSLTNLLDNATIAAGDVIYYRANDETTKDTAATARTITTAGTNFNPTRIIGVKSGTTNTGSGVTTSDLAVRSGDQPVFEVTGASLNDATINGSAVFFGVKFIIDRRFFPSTTHNQIFGFYQCHFENTEIRVGDWNQRVEYYDCEFTSVQLNGQGSGNRYVHGGIWNGTQSYICGRLNTTNKLFFIGVDFSGATISTAFADNGNMRTSLEVKNCKLPTSMTWLGDATPDTPEGYLMAIGCSDNTAAKGSGTSYQNYYYADIGGVIENEATVVRTSGATDGATGTFSYKMTPHANQSIACTLADIKSPWLRVWVAGGVSTTLTVYTVHDDAGTIGRDLYETELWVEWWTPDADDDANHDYTFEGFTDFFLDGTTTAAGTDDTASTWATYNTYKRSFSTTVTPGFEGWAYARVHLAQASATPVTLYVDPKIEVS